MITEAVQHGNSRRPRRPWRLRRHQGSLRFPCHQRCGQKAWSRHRLLPATEIEAQLLPVTREVLQPANCGWGAGWRSGGVRSVRSGGAEAVLELAVLLLDSRRSGSREAFEGRFDYGVRSTEHP